MPYRSRLDRFLKTKNQLTFPFAVDMRSFDYVTPLPVIEERRGPSLLELNRQPKDFPPQWWKLAEANPTNWRELHYAQWSEKRKAKGLPHTVRKPLPSQVPVARRKPPTSVPLPVGVIPINNWRKVMTYRPYMPYRKPLTLRVVIREGIVWLSFLLVGMLAVAKFYGQQLPLVNHNGVEMFAPDKPFESLKTLGLQLPGIYSGSATASVCVDATGNVSVSGCSGANLPDGAQCEFIYAGGSGSSWPALIGPYTTVLSVGPPTWSQGGLSFTGTSQSEQQLRDHSTRLS